MNFDCVSQKLVDPVKIEKWAIVNFSARCDIRYLCNNLIKCGDMKGIVSVSAFNNMKSISSLQIDQH